MIVWQQRNRFHFTIDYSVEKCYNKSSGIKEHRYAGCLMDKIFEAIRRIAVRYEQIEKIVLFGSRARGDNSERSDIDIAVYADGDIFGFIYEIDEKVPTLLRFDVTQMSGDLEKDFIDQIENEGVIIYEKH